MQTVKTLCLINGKLNITLSGSSWSSLDLWELCRTPAFKMCIKSYPIPIQKILLMLIIRGSNDKSVRICGTLNESLIFHCTDERMLINIDQLEIERGGWTSTFQVPVNQYSSINIKGRFSIKMHQPSEHDIEEEKENTSEWSSHAQSLYELLSNP